MFKIVTFERNQSNSTVDMNQCHVGLSDMHILYVLVHAVVIVLIPMVFSIVLLVLIVFLKIPEFQQTDKPVTRTSSIYRSRMKRSCKQTKSRPLWKPNLSPKHPCRNLDSVSSKRRDARFIITEIAPINSGRKTLSCIVLTLVISFYVCQLPTRLFMLWSLNHKKHRASLVITQNAEAMDLFKRSAENLSILNTLSNLARFMYFLHGILNPIVHFVSSSAFRQAFLSVLFCSHLRSNN
jgi:hypothetical protein